METTIKVSPCELNENLFNKIRKFIGSKDNIDVTISLKEFNPEYADALDHSMKPKKEKTLFPLPWKILWLIPLPTTKVEKP